MKTHSCSSRRSHRLIAPLALVLLLLTIRDAGSIKIEIGAAAYKSAEDLAARATLSWDAVPGVLYTIQRSASISGGGNNVNWLFGNAVIAESTKPQVDVPLTEASQFFRVAAPVQITSIEPSFVDSSDTNAVFYLLGQFLPTDATVFVNGVAVSSSPVGSNGVWRTVCCLPPGQPIRSIVVVETGTSNVVATFNPQTPVTFDISPTLEQLQGPSDDPPASPLATLLMPALMKAKEKANRTKCGNNLRITLDGDPLKEEAHFREVSGFNINPSSGEVQCEETDLSVAGRGLHFAWTRTYRSRTGSPTAMGHNWDFSYNVSLAAGPNGTMILRTGDGRVNTFYPNGTNGWARDEYFVEIRDLDQDGMQDVLFANGGKWFFHPLDGSPTAGMLRRFCDKSENAADCNYDGTGRLIQVVDTLDRTNTIAYNAVGLIASVTDFSGRTVRYEYDGAGDLVTVVSPPVTGTPTGNDFPGGKTNRYTYTAGNLDERLNHNLASCTDPNGQRWLQIFYRPPTDPAHFEFDTVNGVLRGIGPFAHLRRYPQTPSPTNGFATVKAIMRDPVGNVTEEFYDSRGRCVRMLEYTGRAPFLGQPTTEVDNRPVNKLRAEDPEFYETQWEYNRDSLCTMHTAIGDGNGRINRVRYFYSSQLEVDISPRKKGDCRIIRQFSDNGAVDTDGDGVGDTSELTWQFDYDSRFGSGGKIVCNYVRRDKTTYGMQDFEKNTENVSGGFGLIGSHGGGPNGQGLRKGWDGTIKGSGINEPLPDVVLHRKGWDGTIKGRFALDSDANFYSRGPRQSTSIDGSFSHRDFGTKSSDSGPYWVCYSVDGLSWSMPSGGHGGTCTPICNDGFVISATDPRGVVSTATYDANGKSIQWEPHKSPGLGSPVLEFAYNSFGQLTAITNAADGNGRRSVTRFIYGDDPLTPQVEPTVPFYIGVIADEGGLQLTNRFEYDVRGNVTRAVDASGNDRVLVWNALDQCVRVETPTNIFARCATDFIYDANDNLQRIETQQRDANDVAGPGHLVLIGHDFLDRVTSITKQVSTNHFVTNRYEYDANDQLTAAYTPRAVTGADPHTFVIYATDELGRRFREIHGPGSGSSLTNQWSYDRSGKVKKAESLDDGLHYLLIVAYDDFGRPGSITDSMSNVVSHVWDRSGNLRLTRTTGELNDGPGSGNVRLSEWQGKYDRQNRLTQSQSMFFNPATQTPIGDGVSLTTYTYAPNDQCLSVTDDNGHTTSYGYDTACRLSSVTGPNQKTSFAILRDRLGNVTSSTQMDRSDIPGLPQVFVESFAYDSLNRQVAHWDNVGNTNRYAYNSRGDMVRHTDPLGAITRYEYDGLSRKTRVFQDMNDNDIVEATDIVVTQTWDDNSRPASVTDDNTNTTYYVYNWMDCIISITSPDGTGSSLVWSPRSNLILETDANGTVISNSFDALDRCIRRDITPGAGVAATTTFESFGYNGLSQTVAATNNISIRITPRDSFGNCASSTQDGRTTTYAYDGEGNCLSMTYPSGFVVTYTYNELDEVSTITKDDVAHPPPVITGVFGYAGPGRVAQINRANGTRTDNRWNGLVSPPNAPGDFGRWQRSGIGHTLVVNSAVIDRRIAAFDRNQNRILRAQTVAFSPINDPVTNTWNHDALNRMTESALFRGNSVASKSYVLDGNGNRQVVFSNGLAQPYFMDNTPAPGPADFQMDQYTVTPFGDQTFDPNGNMVSRTTTAAQLMYQYDYANRLVSVTDLYTGAPVLVASYAYNAMGQRISKTVYPPVPSLPETTEYVYGGPDDCDDGDDDIIETWAFGVVGKSFVLDGSRSTDDGTIQNFEWVQTSGPFLMVSGGQDFYFHKDDLGNTLALTDASGNVVERYDYDDFGVPQFLTSDGLPMATNASPIGNPFLFHGMEWDRETGFYSSSARYTGDSHICTAARHGLYDPQIGRDINGIKSKEDVYVWKVRSTKSKEDVYVWKVRGKIKSKEDVYVWKVRSKSKQDVYVWKLSAVEPYQPGQPVYGNRHYQPGRPVYGNRHYQPGRPVYGNLYGPGQPHWGSARSCCAYHSAHEFSGHVTLMK